MASDTPGTPRVSVIVAVYDPGPHFEDLIASFAGQTLAPHEFEVLLCDDGSDAATQARLDRVERAHRNIRVFRLEHTGWPGKPRNTGIDEARGTYVFFCDHDDRLGADALRRMCDYADEHGSDVLVPRVVGVGRSLSRRLYRTNVPHAHLGADPLLDVLTPHKLFRTEFVREHGIRFPDERVRLEDHMFVMKAFFAAQTISILGDYPCYYWMKREDRPSASATRIDPVTYFPHLRTVLDIVEANTEPGELRNQLLSHWYRGKILKRLAGKQFLGYDEEYRALFLSVITPLVQERFGPELDEYLAFPMRVRSALLRAGRVDDLLALARIEAGMTGHADVTALRWSAGKKLILEIATSVTDEHGAPLTFEPTTNTIMGDGEKPAAPGLDGDDGPAEAAPVSQVWRSSELPSSPVLVDGLLDATPDLARDGVSVFLRDQVDGADYHQKVRGPGLSVVATVDPRNARGGRRVTKGSELVAQVRHAGWTFMVPVRVPDEAWPSDPEELSRVIGQRELTVERSESGKVGLRARQLTPAELAVLNPAALPPTGLGARAAKALDQLAASVPERAREAVPEPAKRLAQGLRRRLRGR